MKAWHGTNKKFDRFDPGFAGTGEGVAARGLGFNAACDKAVALHYLQCSPGPVGYLYEVAVPELDALLNLDATASVGGTPCPVEVARAIYLRHHDLDLDEVFDEAANHDDISFSYSDERAEEMFDRLILNVSDPEASEELREWSPGYDWDRVEALLAPANFGLDPDYDTGRQLYSAMIHACGSEGAAQKILLEHHVLGTYGSEPIASRDKSLDSISVAIFRADDITIIRCQEVDRTRSRERDDGGPGL